MIYTTSTSIPNMWAFIHIPKTSGSNFQERSLVYPNIINAHKELPKYWRHNLLQWWLDEGILNSNYLIFTFVRNPYSRIVSLYNHMLTSGNNPNLPPFKEFIMNDVVDNIVPNNWTMNYNFGSPQYKWIEHDQPMTVKYFKMESDLHLVELLIGYKFADTRINAKKHKHFEEYYDKESKKKVQEKYEEDFIRFKYAIF